MQKFRKETIQALKDLVVENDKMIYDKKAKLEEKKKTIGGKIANMKVEELKAEEGNCDSSIRHSKLNGEVIELIALYNGMESSLEKIVEQYHKDIERLERIIREYEEN